MCRGYLRTAQREPAGRNAQEHPGLVLALGSTSEGAGMTEFPLIDDGTDWGPKCIECGQFNAGLVGGQAIYPHRRDLYAKNFWLCSCGAYCGCHPNSTNPLGYPAGRETRKARSALHAVLDPLWKGAKQKKKRRNSVYAFLSFKLGIPRSETHSAMFDAAMCARAIEALADFDPCWREQNKLPPRRGTPREFEGLHKRFGNLE